MNTRLFGNPDRRNFLKACAATATTAMVATLTAGCVAQPHIQTAMQSVSVPPARSGSTAADRWLELDLYWFKQHDMVSSVEEFWHRYAPLFTGVEGYRGVILNVGWTPEYIMDWSGDLAQRILMPAIGGGGSVAGQQPWVAETAPLTGDWAQRIEQWDMRFGQAKSVPPHGYGPWTYGDLKQLCMLLRGGANERGITDLRVGSLTLAWTAAYGTLKTNYGNRPSFLAEHPEIFTAAIGIKPPFLYFDPGNLLHHDPKHYGGLPDGIPEGMPVHQMFALQWGSLSKAAGLDAIMLRDSFGFPIPYERRGQYGPLAPTAELARKWTATTAALVRETKQANPKALVMMYSNAASAIGDWRCNCCDLETIAKEGYLDIFVDQTWAGAWNEIGTRNTDLWNDSSLGYTFQLAYTLMHAAILADTNVRHYPLTETFDAWESWNVIATVPERLRWEIWAYLHAGVKTPTGLKLPAGSYISWGNQGKRLLTAEDVHFLATNINAASEDARKTTEIFGPTLVYSRETMQWQMDHANPNNDIKEWIDEQAGSVMKWPVPIHSATRLEWLPEVKSDLFILQTPSYLSAAHLKMLVSMINSGQPVAIFGSPAGGISTELESLIGISGVRQNSATFKAALHVASLGDGAAKFVEHIPDQFPTLTRLTTNKATADTQVIYTVDKNPTLLLNTTGGKRVLAWDPPFLRTIGVSNEPLLQIWGGSPVPYAITAGTLNDLLANTGSLHAKQIDMNQTVNISAWRTTDGIRLMAANLDEGLQDNADMSRHVTLVLPSAWRTFQFKYEWNGNKLPIMGTEIRINLTQAQSILLAGGS